MKQKYAFGEILTKVRKLFAENLLEIRVNPEGTNIRHFSTGFLLFLCRQVKVSELATACFSCRSPNSS